MYSAGVVTIGICRLWWKVPGAAGHQNDAKCPGQEALNAWRDIAEVLECACQQLGQNCSGLIESHFVTKNHSCMR